MSEAIGQSAFTTRAAASAVGQPVASLGDDRRGVVLPANQRLILFTLLVLVCAAFNILLSPMGEPGGDSWGMIVAVGRMGCMFGQPALLGLWAALGPQRPAVRLPGALLLVVLFAYTMLLSEVWSSGGYARSDTLWDAPLIGVGLLVTTQTPFWLLRRFRGWHLQLVGSDGAEESDDRRFGLFLMLSWITLASVVFALWRALPVDDHIGQTDLLEMLGMVLVFSIPSLPLVPLSAFVLSDQGRWKLGMAIALLMAVCPPLALQLANSFGGGGSWGWEEFIALYGFGAGMLLVGVIVLSLARAVGWRLVRPKARRRAPIVLTERSNVRRFGLLLATIVALALLNMVLAIEREPTRQRMIAAAGWTRVNLMPIRGQGNKIIGVVAHNTVLTDKQVAAIGGGKDQLQTLNLIGSSFTEEQFARLMTNGSIEDLQLSNTNLTPAMLAELKRLPRLRWLDLTGSTISDADLAALGALTTLQHLKLTGTSIGDDRLVDLAPLQNLVHVDLPVQNVTPDGVERLRELLPKANVTGPVAPPPTDAPGEQVDEAAPSP